MPGKNPLLPTGKRLSVSSWSLHHHLGAPPISGPDREVAPFDGQRLLELPSKLKEFGIGTLEICHFHLPSRDEAFLDELNEELQENAIELWALLIDEGDLNSPQHAQRDQNWISSWLPVAAKLGARNARVIAGKGAPTPENMAQSIAALNLLADEAEKLGVGLLTENWFDLTGTPASTVDLLDAMQGKLGLMMDFGNWKGASKYRDLWEIAPYAKSCHTKAAFSDGQIDRHDYESCLDITREAGFDGPYTLIYDSGGDEWAGLDAEREVVRPYLS